MTNQNTQSNLKNLSLSKASKRNFGRLKEDEIKKIPDYLLIKKAVDRAVEEYGETLKKLAKDDN